MENKHLIVIALLVSLFVGIQKSKAQSPENVLNEMRNVNQKNIKMKEYFQKLFTYYDTPSKKLINDYIENDANELGISVDDYYKLLDTLKSTMKNISFDVFTNLLSKGSMNNCGFSNYSQYRSINKNNFIEITETANFDIHKYLMCLRDRFPKMFDFLDTNSMNEFEDQIKNSLPDYVYKDGKITNNTYFIKENGKWKIHFNKQQADHILPGNNYQDKIKPDSNEKPEIPKEDSKNTNEPEIELTINSVSIENYDDVNGNKYYSSASFNVDFVINVITDYSSGGAAYNKLMKELYDIAIHCKCRIYYKSHKDNNYSFYTESSAWYSKKDHSSSITNSDVGYPNKELNHGKYDFMLEFYSNYDNKLLAKATPESYSALGTVKLETVEQDNSKKTENDNQNESKPTDPLKGKVEDLLAQAQQFEKENNFESAAEKYKKIAISYPYSKYTQMSIKKGAIEYFRLKKYDEVIKIIKLSDLSNNENAENLQNLFNYLLGMSYYLKKNPDYENSIIYLKKVTETQSKNKNVENALYSLAVCYEKTDDIKGAFMTYNKYVKLFPEKKQSAEKAIQRLAYNYSKVNIFVSSDKTEGALAGYHDPYNKFNNTITVQIFDSLYHNPITGCGITLLLTQPIKGDAFVVDKKFKELKDGCYSLAADENTMGSFLSYIGLLDVNFEVTKEGFPTKYIAKKITNVDLIQGFNLPQKGYLFGFSNFEEPTDLRGKALVNGKKYYSIDVIPKRAIPSIKKLLLPFSADFHYVPETWDEYFKATKAVNISRNFPASLSQVQSFVDNSIKLKKYLKIHRFASKSIDILVPVLNALILKEVKVPSPGIKKIVTKQISKFLLNEVSMPNKQVDAYLYYTIQASLSQIKDSLNNVILSLRFESNTPNLIKLNEHELFKKYSNFKFALINYTIACDIINSFIINKSIWVKLYETELHYLLGKSAPQAAKAIELSQYFLKIPQALSSFERSTRIIQYFNDFEKSWDKDGPSKDVFQKFKGKIITRHLRNPIPVVQNFHVSYKNGKYIIFWDALPNELNNDIKYTIKYNTLKINDNNWRTSTYIFQSQKFPNINGKHKVILDNLPENLFFGIKVQIGERGLSSLPVSPN